MSKPRLAPTIAQTHGETDAARPSAEQLICGRCRYELRGISSDRCPECGQRFDIIHLISDLVPWEGRRLTGRIRAFCATVWEGTFRPGTLARRAAWPVDWAAARTFRRCAIAIGMLSLIGGGIWWRMIADNRLSNALRQGLPSQSTSWVFLLNPWSFGVTLLALAIWLATAVTAVSSLNYSRRLSAMQQKRAVALSAYACAPLAWLPVVFLLGSGTTSILESHSPVQSVGHLLQAMSWMALAVQAILWMRARRRGKEAPAPKRFRLSVAGVSLAVLGIADWMAFGDWGPRGGSYISSADFDPAIAGLVAFAVVMAALWWNCLRLLRSTTSATWTRTIVSGIALPLIWLALLIGIVGTLQAAFIIVQFAIAAQ